MTDEQIIKNLKEIIDGKIIRNTTCIISLGFLNEILGLIKRTKYESKEYRNKYQAVKEEVTRLYDKVSCQKAEIESLKQIIDEEDKEIIKLQKRIVFWRESLNYQPEKVKSEAIKEFAEWLKSRFANLSMQTKTHGRKITSNYVDDIANQILHDVVPQEIDNLVKEMTEEVE